MATQLGYNEWLSALEFHDSIDSGLQSGMADAKSWVEQHAPEHLKDFKAASRIMNKIMNSIAKEKDLKKAIETLGLNTTTNESRTSNK